MGNGYALHDSPSFEWVTTLFDLKWSQDGSKLAFVDISYEKIDDCHYNGYLVVIDLKTRDKRHLKFQMVKMYVSSLNHSTY